MNTHQNDKSKFGGGGEEQGGRQEPTSKGHSPIPQVCISSKATVFLYFFMQFNKAPPPPPFLLTGERHFQLPLSLQKEIKLFPPSHFAL